MNEIDTLESMVKRPALKKKPSNAALWAAYIFFNIVALVFDIIAANTVYDIMKNWGYAIVTFLAGFVPLFLHEFLYIRAYAGDLQRKIAIGGAVFAVLTIGSIAFLAAGANIAVASGYIVENESAKWTIIIIVVSAMLIHAVLTAVYFYADEGIRATHTASENEAWFDQRDHNLDLADRLLTKAESRRLRKQNILGGHGNTNDVQKALQVLLKSLGDDDGDGIPNFADKDYRGQGKPQERPHQTQRLQPAVQYQKTVKQPDLAESEENPTQPGPN